MQMNIKCENSVAYIEITDREDVWLLLEQKITMEGTDPLK